MLRHKKRNAVAEKNGQQKEEKKSWPHTVNSWQRLWQGLRFRVRGERNALVRALTKKNVAHLVAQQRARHIMFAV